MQVAKLAVHQDDAQILLEDRNVLDQLVVDKYRAAGRVTQTALQYVLQLIADSYHRQQTARPYTAEELCILGDSMMHQLLAACYTDSSKVREKGIAHPVTLDVNEHVANTAPEAGATNGGTVFVPGDIVTVALGAHVDGYAATAAHTLVIYPPGETIDGVLRPAAPLLGSKADAVVACHLATRAAVALLSLAAQPDKLAWVPELQGARAVTGAMLRLAVDRAAASFGCVVVPGSKVRRVRRFLAGQAEGVVAERDFKGVVWDESNQEADLLTRAAGAELAVRPAEAAVATSVASAVPTDDFVVEPGEAYAVDVRVCAVTDFAEKGLVTLQEADDKPTVYVRDFAVTHALKLASARELLALVDRDFSVFPFKLAHTCAAFPVDLERGDVAGQLAAVRREAGRRRLGLNELANRYLARPKPVQTVRHVPFSTILTASNPTGRHGVDAARLSLPGREVPLPALGVSALKLKALLKHGAPAPAVAREVTTVVLNGAAHELVRLTGGAAVRPSWVHSRFQVAPDVAALLASVDALKLPVKEVQPQKLNAAALRMDEPMCLD